MILLDTNAMIFDALAPERLSEVARTTIEEGGDRGTLACCDISLWEIAMLIHRGRLTVDLATTEFLEALLTARAIQVLPISPQIAALSQSAIVPDGDPADRLIAASAVYNGARLVTSDRRLRRSSGVETVW